MKLLLGPLQKLANLIEDQNKKMDEVHKVLTVDLVGASEETNNILVFQTKVLLDIKKSINAQLKQGSSTEKKKGKSKLDTPNTKGLDKVGLAVISMAGALVVSAGLFMLMPVLNPMALLSALAVAAIITIITPSFVKIAAAVKGMNQKDLIATSLAIPIIATGMVLASGIFMLMASVTANMAPDPIWVLKSGLALAVFGLGFSLILDEIKGLSIKELLIAGSAIPIIALAIVSVGFIFSTAAAYLKSTVAPDLGWTLKAGLAIAVFALPFSMIVQSLTKKITLKQIGLTALALPLIAIAIVGVGAIFAAGSDYLQTEVAPDLGWTLTAGLAVALFAIPFGLVVNALTKNVSIKDIGLAALALPLIAAGLIGTAWMFGAMPIDAWVAPPIDWVGKAALAVLLFAIPFAGVAMVSNKIGFKGLIMGALALPLIAAGILGAAWLFSYLPGEFIAPPFEWAMSAAIAITAFAIPFAIVGMLAQAITPLGLVLGAAGIVLIAGSMWAVAWIFSKMPDLSAISKNITDALMYPVNAMITALGRFKNEIGVENLLPLAGGILAIAGSWLALTAALAGQAAGGLVSSVANLGSAIIDGIGGLFGGGETKSPIDLLDMLIDRQAGIMALADPVKVLGENFATMSQYTEAVITGVTAFSPFLDEDSAENFTESANAATTLALAYEKLANASNIMNVAAITESTKMFEAIAKVAEADGEDAMTVLAEKLMEAVKQLSETVGNLQEANGENTNSMKDAMSSTIGGFVDKIKGKTDNSGGNEPGLVDVAPIVAAIQELEDRLNRPLRVEEA